jgi:outer membrane protein assembly factor BamD (BamD/ComL family)
MPTEHPTSGHRFVAWPTVFAAALMLALATGSGCTHTLGAKRGQKSFRQKVTDSIKSTLNTSYHDNDSDAKLSEADELFAGEQFAASQAIYADLADNTYNSGQMREKARFMEAESCRLRGRIPASVATYNRYLQDHPGGVYSKQSAERMFAVAEGWLKETLPDLEEAQSGKRWLKLPKLPNPFDNSRPMLDSEGELVKTFENIAVGAPNAPCAEKSMFWAGYLHYARGRYEDADHFFSTLAEMYKDSPLRQEAVKYAIDAKTRVTGGAHYDGQKANEALQLVHNLEASEPVYRSEPAKAEWATKQKLSIRGSQAERDFETAEYYRRTSRFGSAFFYYELVKRRYPGTMYSDRASERIDEIKRLQAQKSADKAAGKVNPLEVVQDRLDSLFGNKPKIDDEPTAEPTPTRPKDRPAPIIPNGGFDR